MTFPFTNIQSRTKIPTLQSVTGKIRYHLDMGNGRVRGIMGSGIIVLRQVLPLRCALCILRYYPEKGRTCLKAIQ
ncbi:hypothetical protein DPMN_055413 [Dreissena polymorpha]|uniref:Uncharacterized protein n=1 Tax=Dreissena polymorpha TaxID=45954 RepID=A0A9D4CRT6_DREPO|nr:hypothetical protein DPMN_055413 [Dreissena polymorpha]